MATLREARIRNLLHEQVSFDYFGPEETNDGKARWVCLGCDPSKSFNTYPAFERHLIKEGQLGE